MALLPYTKRVASVGRGPRGPRGPRGGEEMVDQVQDTSVEAENDELDTDFELGIEELNEGTEEA
jgi:hypothetical protein